MHMHNVLIVPENTTQRFLAAFLDIYLYHVIKKWSCLCAYVLCLEDFKGMKAKLHTQILVLDGGQFCQ
jgi:hypothetical protein